MNKQYNEKQIEGIDRLLRTIDLDAYLEAKGLMMVRMRKQAGVMVNE